MYLLLFFFLILKLLFVFRKFDYIVSCCGPISAQTIWDLLDPIDLGVPFSPQVWKVFSQYCFKYNLCPFVFFFWISINANIVGFFLIFCNSHRISSLFFILFAPLTGSFPMCYPPGEWFFLLHAESTLEILYYAVIILSNSKISCFLFYGYHFLMNFSFCSWIDFLFLFNYLSVFSCSPLKLLKMIVLNSLS